MRARRAIAVALLSVLMAVALAAPAFAAPRGDVMAAEGEWTWVNTSFREKVHQHGSAFLAGDEMGTWTGTFVGESYDKFIGHVDASGELHGTVWVEFEHVSVNGAQGGLKLRFSWYAHDSYFGGGWKILGGSGELRHLRGEGQWQWYDDVGTEGGARYSGVTWGQ